MVLETCKSLPMARGFFYDELAGLIDYTTLHPSVLEWMSRHTGEFETVFLLDLEGGQLQVEPGDCCGLQGEIWMNLDGDVSPICLNVLPLLTSYQRSPVPANLGNLILFRVMSSQALQFLPSNFFLLAVVERLTNQGSLGSIDALLGCPLYLPAYKLLLGDAWKSLPRRQKQIACLSLYYGASWTRELINAFSTQIADQMESITQVTQEETTAKLLKRLRNLLLGVRSQAHSNAHLSTWCGVCPGFANPVDRRIAVRILAFDYVLAANNFKFEDTCFDIFKGKMSNQ
eukprot:Gb_40797 [translate_table: standard]